MESVSTNGQMIEVHKFQVKELCLGKMQFFRLTLQELDSLDGPGTLLVDLASEQREINKGVSYSNIESIDGDNDPWKLIEHIPR